MPGPAGTQPPAPALIQNRDPSPPSAGFAVPGPIGTDPIPLTGGTRTVIAVTKDWEPPAPRTTPANVVRGATLAAVFTELNANAPWGRGGGELRTDPVPRGTTTEVTVAVHANLRLIMPTWTRYDQASPAARAEWDRMIATLRVHENRHVEIAIEEANTLAANLIGVEVGEIANLVTTANQAMQTRQDQLDTETDSGSRENVRYGNVYLDTSIV